MKYIGYGSSVVSLAMFVYSFFYTPEGSSLKEQAIYWFLIAIAAACLPSIQQLKYKDLEVLFKEGLGKVEKQTASVLRGQVQQMHSTFFNLLSLKEFDEAKQVSQKTLDLLDEASSSFPDDPNFQALRAYTFKNLAMVMRQLGNEDQFQQYLGSSATTFERLLRQYPEDASALNGLGSVWLLRGNPDKAVDYMQKAVDLKPDYGAAIHDLQVAREILAQRGRSQS